MAMAMTPLLARTSPRGGPCEMQEEQVECILDPLPLSAERLQLCRESYCYCAESLLSSLLLKLPQLLFQVSKLLARISSFCGPMLAILSPSVPEPGVQRVGEEKWEKTLKRISMRFQERMCHSVSQSHGTNYHVAMCHDVHPNHGRTLWRIGRS